jgi:hypothetical protein
LGSVAEMYVSPVRYELDFISQKTAFFLVTAVKASELLGFTCNIIGNNTRTGY